MTRRNESGRVTPAKSGADPEPPANRARSSLRQRNPVAYWVAIIAVVAMVLATIASSLSAVL